MYVCGITPYDATHLGHAATYLAFDLVHRAVAGPRPRGALRAERHRRRRSVVRARQSRRHRLARPRATARSRCSARTWRRCGYCPHATMSGPPKRWPKSSNSSKRCWPPVRRTSSMTSTRTSISGRTPRRSSATSRATTAKPCCGCSSSAAATRIGPARPTSSTPCCGGPRGRGSPAGRRRSVRAGRAGTSNARRSRSAASARGLDIQGGGSDLIFPHHEFTAAHAECVSGERRFARHYVHAGMIGWDGHKMSKSRGNLVLVSALRAQGVEPSAIRLGLLAGHYRADRFWSRAVLDEAIARLQRWRTATALPAGPDASDVDRPRAADTWPTIWIRPKPLPHLMVGPPMRWSTAATTRARRDWWRPRSMRCSGWTCRRRSALRGRYKGANSLSI